VAANPEPQSDIMKEQKLPTVLCCSLKTEYDSASKKPGLWHNQRQRTFPFGIDEDLPARSRSRSESIRATGRLMLV